MILDVFEKAIREKRCVTVVHLGTTRRVAAHAVGFTRDGVPAAFVFQYAGETTSALPFKGEWRCLHLEHLSHASENGDRWRSPSNYSLSRQTCLQQIALAVPETQRGCTIGPTGVLSCMDGPRFTRNFATSFDEK